MRVYTSLLICFVALGHCFGQIQVTSSNVQPLTPQNLIENVFLGTGVNVLDVQYVGDNEAVGLFENGTGDIGIERGIVMSTGQAEFATQNENLLASFEYNTMNVDPDIDQIATDMAWDLCQYRITFIPSFDTLRFNYVFASEEYPDFVCSAFNANDVFGFFISGPGYAGPYENGGENIALVPGTGQPVSIGTVNNGGPLCPPQNVQFYNDNDGSATFAYGAYLDIFTATAVVMPCDTYEIKLSLADVADALFDSAVFLEAKSFGTRGLEVTTSSASIDGTIAEGCSPGILRIELPEPADMDTPLDINLLGDAINGTDYTFINTNQTILQGQDFIEILVDPIQDGQAEGQEVVSFDIQVDLCTRDTFTFIIRESPLSDIMDTSLPDTLEICIGDSEVLDGSINLVPDAPFTFTNNTTVPILPPLDQAKISQISVTGVPLTEVGPGVIKFVCIDSLEHERISDVIVYLRAPDGAFIELTSGNGEDGGNGLGLDLYDGTCFNPDATSIISDPGPFAPASAVPFTGDFLPEGDFSDLYGSPVNGDWQLVIVDSENGAVGNLFSWTICFAPLYNLAYDWQPPNNLSCSDCPMPTYVATTSTDITYTITDSYGCDLVDNMHVNVQQNVPNFTPNCRGSSASEIEIGWISLGGGFTEEVNISNTGWVPADMIDGHTFTGLDALNSYFIEVRIFNSCDTLVRSIMCTTSGCDFTYLDNTVVDSVSCFGGSDGSITIFPPNMGAEVFYSWSTMDTTASVNNLPAGLYTVQVFDTTGCSRIVDYEIFEPAEPIIFTDSIDVDCFSNSTGAVSVTMSGGTFPYSFSWTPNLNPTSSTNNYTDIPAGTYFVDITDANNCIYRDSVEVNEPNALLVTADVDSTNCSFTTDGAITLLVSGGTGPYTYTWSNGDTDSTNVDLAPGLYDYTVTDARNCEVIGTEEVFAELPITVQISSPGINCAGELASEIVVEIVGNTDEDYDFLWTYQNSTDSVLTDVPGGTYYVSITDGNNCEVVDSITIVEPNPIVINPVVEPRPCDETDNGFIQLNLSGGTDPVTVSWQGPNGFTSSMEDIMNLTEGDFDVLIQDGNGCSLRDTFTIGTRDPIQATADVMDVSCNGEDDGSINLSLMGGTGPYTISWDAPLSSSSNLVQNLAPGTYEADLEDSDGCQRSVQYTITEPPAIDLIANAGAPSCSGQFDGSIEVSATGGIGTITFGLNGQNFPAGTTTIGNLGSGTYTVFAFDENNCSASQVVSIENADGLEVDLGESQLLLGEGSVQVTATVTNDVGGLTFIWSSQDSVAFSCQNCPSPLVTIFDNSIIEVYVEDMNGCSGTAQVGIFVKKIQEVFVPTGFSPNDDTFNDFLMVHGPLNTEVLEFVVYNRLGEVVYSNQNFLANDAIAGWNGIYKNKPAPQGVYVWKAQVRFPDGQLRLFNGESTLLR